MNQDQPPVFRLATTDRDGNRIYLYPMDVKGFFRRLRTRLNGFLILLFLGLPWVRISGHQAILLDIPRRRFAIFGATFWGHEAPMLLFIFGGAAFALAFATAIWGRVWCGWGCPQTVFVDGVFRKVERWIEGDSFAQKKLDQAPLDFEKFSKKSLKWGVFALLTLVISHSFLAYFVGTEALAQMMQHSPSENPTSFIVMAFVSLVLLFDFGWFREQFCTVLCPYGRFQSVLMDSRSLVVAYDLKRGEPRRIGIKADPVLDANAGDCINCYKCVRVCPTGIDIRRGIQLECVACTACIDACDEVMTRLHKPTGLIRYGTEAIAEGKPVLPPAMRPRIWVNGLVFVIFMIGLGVTLHYRKEVNFAVLRAVDSPYQVLPSPDGSIEIINHFKIDVQNQTFDEKKVIFQVSEEYRNQGVSLVSSNHNEIVAPGVSERSDLFIRFPKSLLKAGTAEIALDFAEHHHVGVHLVGPFN